jgi:predicted cupin superfamily sugar epimerase
MFRRALIVAFLALLAAPLAAQAPAGWQVRIDRSQSATDPDDTPELKFMTMGKGFHVTGGPAGTFWNPANTAMGDYTLTATFNLLRPSGHVNYYGLVYGGRNLEAANQSYIYFLVAQNGSFTIRHRAGDETVHDIVGRTENAAVVQPDANGQSVNRLQVRVGADETQFVVNGTVVHTAARQGMAGASDGIWGLRVNHVIPGVRVEGLRVTPME